MKAIYLLITITLLSGCSSLPKHSQVQKLKKFDNLTQIEEFSKQRKKAIEKIESYLTKKEFLEKFKFWKSWRESEEIVIVTGFRQSVPEEIIEETTVSSNNITNNQEQYVDEGGIVKRLGNYMIVLRQGKLYSLHIGQIPSKIDVIDVQQENWQHDAWYDEILADNNRIVVVGYSYDTEASEYLFFDLDKHGKFTRGAVHLITSNDYFSGENYASRLVDGNLIFLIKDIPITEGYEEDRTESPINLYTRAINTQGKLTKAHPLFKENRTYAPIIADLDISATTLAVCPLSNDTFSCHATTLLGGYTTETYASRDAYYIWMTGTDWNIPFETMTDKELKRYVWNEYFESVKDNNVSAIYRIPYNGKNVGAVKIQGQPINQFSFKEHNNKLTVLTRTPSEDESYFWAADSAGTTYIASINLNWFEQGIYEYAESDYIKIADDEEGMKLNRFIRNNLLYINNIWHEENKEDIAKITLFSTETLTVTQNFNTSTSVEQLQKVGNNALLIGYTGDDALMLSSLSLSDDRRVVDSTVLNNLEISESRSHGFFYKPNIEGGVFAIPFDIELAEGKNWKKENDVHYDLESSTNMYYTQLNTDLTMQGLGHIGGSKEIVWSSSENCNVSCTDWYGSSRPIFWGDRIFSLIKYELIEGKIENGRISEISRFDFSKGIAE